MRLLRRVAYWFRARTRNTDLLDELSMHRESLEQDFRAKGMSADDARHAARRTMGNETFMREEARGVWIAPRLEHVWTDIRYALRGLRRSPGFTSVAVLSLAVGIGANTAIFGMVHAVLLAKLPIPEAEGLVEPTQRLADKRRDDRFSRAEFDALRAASPALSAFTSTSPSVIVDDSEDSEALDAVDGNYFGLLGLAAQRGRLISAEDDDAQAPVVVVSDRFWRTRLHSDSAAIGRVITIQRQSFTVIGITPPGFAGVRFPGRTTLVIPYGAARLAGLLPSDDRRKQPVNVIGRLKKGESLAQAQRTLEVAWGRCCAQQELSTLSKPGSRLATTLELVDVSRGVPNPKVDVRGEYSAILFALMAGVALLLLIACANVGSLLLARATSRKRELAMRLALGASHGRLVSQLIVESLVLSAFGAVTGLALAQWGTSVLIHANLETISGLLSPTPNREVLLFTVVVSLVSGASFGSIPAMRLLGGDLVAPLKEGGRRQHHQRGVGIDRGIVSLQMALALVLVSAAALLTKTLQNLQRVELNFTPAQLWVTTVETRGSIYERQKMTRQVSADILERVRGTPGVRAAAFTSMAPLAGGRHYTEAIDVPGYQPASEEDGTVDVIAVTPDYFAATGIAMQQGRELLPEDGSRGMTSVIVNEAFVRKFLSGRTVLGQTLHKGGAEGVDVQVVGVAADARYFDLRAPAPPALYVPVTDGSWPFLILVVRTVRGAGSIDAAIARAITSTVPGIPARGTSSLEGTIGGALGRERVTAILASVFGFVALGLAAVGLYGIVAYQVAGRTVEIGIRMALGAREGAVLWLVFRESLFVVSIGVLFGIPMALMAGRAVASQLFGIAPYSIAALGTAIAVLAASGLAASVIPARRAIRVNPITALRAD